MSKNADDPEEDWPAVSSRPTRQAGRSKKRVRVAEERHDVSIAVSAGLFLPGLGQLYNGQVVKGILLICLTVVGVVLFLLLIHNPSTALLVLSVVLLLWLVAIIDAGVIAGRHIRHEPVHPWQWF